VLDFLMHSYDLILGQIKALKNRQALLKRIQSFIRVKQHKKRSLHASFSLGVELGHKNIS